MFKRLAGWFTLPTQSGPKGHYYRENQTMALCGVVFVVQVLPDKKMPKDGVICVRCKKYYEKQQLTKV